MPGINYAWHKLCLRHKFSGCAKFCIWKITLEKLWDLPMVLKQKIKFNKNRLRHNLLCLSMPICGVKTPGII
jgi:hypothetical protein